VVAHAGGVAVRLLADRVGLTGELAAALARRSFRPGHERGRVLVDVATMIAAGGEAIADIDTLRHQGQVLGAVASPPTVWRTLDELTESRRRRVERARAKTRARVWGLLPGGRPPAATVAGTSLPEDLVVLDVDATLVLAHSEKEGATGTRKKTFGFHPIGVWCDNTTELLALTLRPGNAGSNTVTDHVQVLTEAIAQLPAANRRRLLVRADGAGASHGLLDWLTGLDAKRGRHVEYSVGFAVTDAVRQAIARLPASAWQVALDADGDVREHADVAELTGLLDLKSWPVGMRVIVRREHPHPGAPLSLFEYRDGWRYQAFVTNTDQLGPAGQLAFLEARHRAHARVEDRIRNAKDTGLGRLPSRQYTINQAWLTCVTLAADLTAWLRLLALPDPLKACEPKALRYRLLHVPARITRSGRQRRVRFPSTWPWADAVLDVFTRVLAIPSPG
jgi:hypothetical protein